MSAANIRKLQTALHDYARCAAASALETSRHQEANAALENALTDPYPGLRQVVIQTLARRARHNDKGALAALVRALRPQSDVCATAADEIGELWSELFAGTWHCTLDPEPATEALALLLDDKIDQTRIAAGRALGELHDPRAIPVLMEIARGEWGAAISIRRIHEILERRPTAIPLGTVRELSVIENIREPLYDPGESGAGHIEGYRAVECSPIRELALQELRRRVQGAFGPEIEVAT